MIRYFDGGTEVIPQIFEFSAGELHVRIPKPSVWLQTIRLDGAKSKDLCTLPLLVDAIRQSNRSAHIDLILPYMPYGRQDRACHPGDAFSLKVFATQLNALQIGRITTLDPHSIVTPALIENIDVIELQDILIEDIFESYDIIISPDAGASKKIEKVSAKFGRPMVQAHKHRDTATGHISRVSVNTNEVAGKRALIIDDICDGGATFLQLGGVLREAGVAGLGLFVTHGIFSKGTEELSKIFDEILTTDSFPPPAGVGFLEVDEILTRRRENEN